MILLEPKYHKKDAENIFFFFLKKKLTTKKEIIPLEKPERET